MIGRKIAHVTTVDLSLESLLLNQLLALKAAGFDVTGISSPGPHVPAIEAAGIRHVSVPISRKLTPAADLLSLARLYRVMRRERFDIVHTHTPKAGLLGQLAARMARVPIIVNTIHGFYFHERMGRRARQFYILLEKIAGACSNLILSQNAEDLETAVREGICPVSKIKLLGNGIDLRKFDPATISDEQATRHRGSLGIRPDEEVVGFVGRLAARRKGFADFLKAAARLASQRSTARFLIIGGTDHGKPDAVEPSAAADYGIADRCLFLGHRANHELPILYRLMNVLVLPSLFEGLPRVIMEASAMGVPCVVSDVKGNREAVTHGRNGFLVPFGDVGALSGAITRILTEPELASTLSNEGRRMAAAQFDERIVFDKVISEYLRLLATR
jgi:glycosyltransferase involved in cell wall biosynthesis